MDNTSLIPAVDRKQRSFRGNLRRPETRLVRCASAPWTCLILMRLHSYRYVGAGVDMHEHMYEYA